MCSEGETVTMKQPCHFRCISGLHNKNAMKYTR